ncbi:hypothetical protein ASPWEDRAFT_175542 [Aspergillus wentii DTO 134E9]|uniref:Uncharacterized protein n=1 Tax=Aspergillus wentii DTO 134E9 TaxID=1073089 RepID=A0A1L9RBK9_ASPWE|nr:uncharacterized protein ASPWEDRAFT_175542 [Aspergillus wentii DTO 134E9]KAI9934816.1 hypothetical protein MW887_000433 [Aspergillus wentii]OJJ32247.1 hypothetical protein ASPWEDRAFT_175542 [Aspergillus wentii DTO 134E9]
MKLLNLVILSLVGIAAAAPNMEKRCGDVFNTCATDDDCCGDKTCTGEAMGNWVCSDP